MTCIGNSGPLADPVADAIDTVKQPFSLSQYQGITSYLLKA